MVETQVGLTLDMETNRLHAQFNWLKLDLEEDHQRLCAESRQELQRGRRDLVHHEARLTADYQAETQMMLEEKNQLAAIRAQLEEDRKRFKTARSSLKLD